MENFVIPETQTEDLAKHLIPKEKKKRKQHITDERKEELKKIRSEALRKGREASAAKRKAKKESGNKVAPVPSESKSDETPVEIPIANEEPPIPETKPLKVLKKKVVKESVDNRDDELINLKVNNKLMEKEKIQMNNDRNKLENEITSLRRKIKELETPKESPYTAPPPKVAPVEKKEQKEQIKILDDTPKLQKKKFNTRDFKRKSKVFGF